MTRILVTISGDGKMAGAILMAMALTTAAGLAGA
jgi:hypothetical protein